MLPLSLKCFNLVPSSLSSLFKLLLFELQAELIELLKPSLEKSWEIKTKHNNLPIGFWLYGSSIGGDQNGVRGWMAGRDRNGLGGWVFPKSDRFEFQHFEIPQSKMFQN